MKKPIRLRLHQLWTGHQLTLARVEGHRVILFCECELTKEFY